MNMPVKIVTSVLMCALLTAHASAQAPVFNTVALNGDPIPNCACTIAGFGSPSIASSGDVAFNASTNFGTPFPLQTNDLDFESSGGLLEIPNFLEGYNDDWGDPCILFVLDPPSINAAGTVVIFAGVGNRVGCPGGAILKGPNLQALDLFVRVNELPLEEISESNFPGVHNVVMNEFGDVAFLTFSFTREHNAVFIAQSQGDPLVIALGGQHAPGTPDGVVFSSFSNQLVINARSEVAFIGILEHGENVNSTNDTGIWYYKNGTLRLVARKGDTAPGTNEAFSFTGFLDIVISPDQEIAFLARLFTSFSPSGLWRGSTEDDLRLVAGGAQYIPTSLGFDEWFFDFSVPAFSRTGELIFGAAGLTVNDGIWKEGKGLVEPIVKSNGRLDDGTIFSGDPAPGTGGTFTQFGTFAVNGLGAIAFFANYTGSGFIAPNSLWGQARNGEFHRLIQPGQEILTPEGSATVVNLFILNGPGNASGLGSGYSDNNEVAFIAQLDPSDVGLFRLRVGEAPPPGYVFVWSNDIGDDNWHSVANDTSNWNDIRGDTIQPPGASLLDIAIIDDLNLLDGVRLDQQPVSISSIVSQGSLVVSQPLRLDEPSRIDSLVIRDEFGLDPEGVTLIETALELELTGESLWHSGWINANFGRILNSGTMTIEGPTTTAQALPDSLQNAGSVSPRRMIGKYENSEFGGIIAQKSSIQLDDAMIVNENEWRLIAGDITVGPFGGTFNNRSKLIKPDDPETTDSTIDAFFTTNNLSKIIIDTHKLTLRGGGRFGDAGVSFGGGLIQFTRRTFSTPLEEAQLILGARDGETATYQFRGPTTQLSGPPGKEFDIKGKLRVAENALLSLHSGAELKVSHAVLALDGGQIVGAGKVILSNDGDLDWSEGVIGVPGLGNPIPKIVLEEEGRLLIFGTEAQTKTLSGTITMEDSSETVQVSDLTLAGGQILINNGIWTIKEGITIDATDGGAFTVGFTIFSSGMFSFPIVGILSVESDSTVSISAAFDNKGIVSVRSGRLELSGPIAQTSGDHLTGGRWVIGLFNNTTTSVLDMINEAITIIDSGVSVSIGELGSFPQLQLQTNNGQFSLESGITYTVPGSLTNNGSILFSGEGTPHLVVPGALFDNNGVLTMFGVGSVEVDGIFLASGNSITRIDGSLTAARIIVAAGAKFSGNGTINGEQLCNEGNLEPGNSPGQLTINANYFQGAGATLEVELGASTTPGEHDQLLVNGNVSLAGTLLALPLKGSWPIVGQPYEIMVANGGTITGTFDQIVGPGEYSVEYSATAVTVTVLTLPGDTDGDEDLDLLDHDGFQSCMTGPGGGVATGCEIFDFNGDGAIDSLDWCAFQLVFTGSKP